MKIERYYGVTKGKLDNPEIFSEDLRHFEAKRFKMILTDEKKRSNKQNSYIHAVLFPLIRDWWNENKKETDPLVNVTDIKDWVQHQGYWGYKTVGKETIPKSSSEATTTEVVKGIEQLQIRFAKIGLVIPDPNQTEFLED